MTSRIDHAGIPYLLESSRLGSASATSCPMKQTLLPAEEPITALSATTFLHRARDPHPLPLPVPFRLWTFIFLFFLHFIFHCPEKEEIQSSRGNFTGNLPGRLLCRRAPSGRPGLGRPRTNDTGCSGRVDGGLIRIPNRSRYSVPLSFGSIFFSLQCRRFIPKKSRHYSAKLQIK